MEQNFQNRPAIRELSDREVDSVSGADGNLVQAVILGVRTAEIRKVIYEMERPVTNNP